MIDRTAQFEAAVQKASASSSIPARHPSQTSTVKDPFTTTTTALSAEISLLADQVRVFRLDHARSSMMSNVSKSGAAISSGAERLKRKFDELEALLKVTAQTMKASSARTAQGKQHAERVLMTLEQRLAQIAKDFQESLQKRAKSLADRQERQKSLFGEAANYKYSRPTAPVNPTALSYQQTSASPFSAASSQPPVFPSSNATPTGKMAFNVGGGGPPAANAFQPSNTLRHRTAAQPLLIQPTQAPQYDFSNDVDDDDGKGSSKQQMLIRKRDRLETSKSRLQDVERVERTIGELSQMFLRVAGMVKEQGEVIDDIESLVDDTAANTSQAQTELLKLFRFVSSDRGLIIKILAVTLILGMIIIYFWT